MEDNTSITLSNDQLSDRACEIRALKMVTKWSANYKENGRNTDRNWYFSSFIPLKKCETKTKNPRACCARDFSIFSRIFIFYFFTHF